MNNDQYKDDLPTNNAEGEQPEVVDAQPADNVADSVNAVNNGSTTGENMSDNNDDSRFDERLERLGGEPAPVITPEEFARLQKAGQVHIDSRGRVRTTRRSDAEAGVSLRKRRAWY